MFFIEGKDGRDGLPGKDGVGLPGKDGSNGAPGKDGSTGPPGPRGKYYDNLKKI